MRRPCSPTTGVRALLLAVQSWLSLCAAPTPLCAQSGAADAPKAGEPLADEEIRALLTRLDAFFPRGDLRGYLAAFAPDHPGAHAMRQRQLESLFTSGRRLRRTSVVATESRQIGPRTVVRVHHEVHVAGAVTAEAKGDAVFREDTMLALHRGSNGDLVPTFEVEIPIQAASVPGDLLRCPACNYEIGGSPGWLCVPMRNDRAQSLEAASFYLIGTDLACDVSVQIDPGAPPAATVAHMLGETLRGLDPSAVPGQTTKWLPRAHLAQTPPGFAGARLEITLPQDAPAAGGGRAVFHVITFGGLQHLLLARGSAPSLLKHAASLQELLDSYRLLDLDADRALAAALPLHHHTGGSLHGSVYRNELYGLELTGPADWIPQQRCGGAAFRIVWSSPNGSRMYLTGYRVPAGMAGWTTETADRWLHQLCESAALQASGANGASGWTDDTVCGGHSRSLVCTPSHPAIPGAPRHRRIRLHVRNDLLLVADGYAAIEADEEALQTALRSMRRL